MSILKRCIAVFVMSVLPTVCIAHAESADQAIARFVKEIGLRAKLLKEFDRTVERVANQTLMEVTRGGAAAATDEKWLERVNAVRPIANRAFDAAAIIKELHFPYYRQYYTEEEMRQLSEYHKMIKAAVEQGTARSILEARAADFAGTSAGKKYLELRQQEIMLWDVTRERIEKIARDSAAKAFSE